MDEMKSDICNDCPRNCNTERSFYADAKSLKTGYRGKAFQPIVARAALHRWEEPCISGTRGSGTVFFGGCNLRCIFCQNDVISQHECGIAVTVTELKNIYHRLITQGAHNINLVTPSHYIRAVEASLDEKIPVPVIYNCGGYEKPETLQRLKGKVQIWLPDLKYISSTLSSRYSNAYDYDKVAKKAILTMYDQVGDYEMNDDGILQKGVIIRHLILPNAIDNSKRIIDWVENHFSEGQVLFSLMRQYIPCGKTVLYPEINRPLTTAEYDEVESYLFNSTIEDGFVQETGCADDTFIPAFDGTGVKEHLIQKAKAGLSPSGVDTRKVLFPIHNTK